MDTFSDQEFKTCLKVLQCVSKDTSLVANEARFKALVAKINKQAKREKSRLLREACYSEDRLAFDATGRVALEREAEVKPHNNKQRLLKPIRCYICKNKYQQLDHFYHRLCSNCAEINHRKRSQRVDLTHRIAIVTGGRIKIGYELVLKLLRDGARVVVTTRFPNDALKRFSKEKDFNEFQHRLQLYGLDLRHLPSVEEFIRYIETQYSHIDILINNAAQTIKRPGNFYEELYKTESTKLLQCVSEKQSLIVKGNAIAYEAEWVDESFFPASKKDRFLQPVDQCPDNSWLTTLATVPKLEFMEAQVINYFSPFFLASCLKQQLGDSPFPDRYIVNVSAMEGQFARESKTHFHPHTNMAKAALNMMTRTSAADYAQSGIYMNSVDTGWITQENPYPKAQDMASKGFVPPLDEIDGAARVYDPIVQGGQGHFIYGHFLKDYKPYEW